MPRKTYSVARATLAESAQARGAGASTGSLMLPLLLGPSARAGPIASAALSPVAAAKRAILEILNVMVASLLIRL